MYTINEAYTYEYLRLQDLITVEVLAKKLGITTEGIKKTVSDRYVCQEVYKEIFAALRKYNLKFSRDIKSADDYKALKNEDATAYLLQVLLDLLFNRNMEILKPLLEDEYKDFFTLPDDKWKVADGSYKFFEEVEKGEDQFFNEKIFSSLNTTAGYNILNYVTSGHAQKARNFKDSLSFVRDTLNGTFDQDEDDGPSILKIKVTQVSGPDMDKKKEEEPEEEEMDSVADNEAVAETEETEETEEKETEEKEDNADSERLNKLKKEKRKLKQEKEKVEDQLRKEKENSRGYRAKIKEQDKMVRELAENLQAIREDLGAQISKLQLDLEELQAVNQALLRENAYFMKVRDLKKVLLLDMKPVNKDEFPYNYVSIRGNANVNEWPQGEFTEVWYCEDRYHAFRLAEIMDKIVAKYGKIDVLDFTVSQFEDLQLEEWA